MREVSEEVFYADGPITKVTAGDIATLKARAAGNRRRRSRLCAHPGTDDGLHEMLIVHSRGAYVPPHRHRGKSESFHMIEGELDVVIFTEDGGIREVISMAAPGEKNSGRPFYYRLSDSYFHTVIPVSEVVVFHETTNGPFRREDTDFAAWAPAESDPPAAQAAFLDGLRARTAGAATAANRRGGRGS